MSRSKGKNAVLLAHVPDDFSPSSVSALPETIVSAALLRGHVPMSSGIELCRTFNAEQLAAGTVTRWALLVKYIRPRKAKGGGQ